jgi:hypothetical protein
MARRAGSPRSSAGLSSSTTTTIDRKFGRKLKQNNIVRSCVDARAPDDIAKIRELLDQERESEPPDLLDYKEYRVASYANKRTVAFCAYSLLAKRTAKRGTSGYLPRLNQACSEADNHLVTGLSDARPDLVESFCIEDYPLAAVEALSGELAPSSYDDAIDACLCCRVQQ